MSDLSTPLLDALNDRVNNPNIRCDGTTGGPPVETQVAQVVVTENPTLQPTRPPTSQPTRPPTFQPVSEPVPIIDTVNGGDDGIELMGEAVSDESQFYPYFESDIPACSDDMNRPDYIQQNMLASESECCETYYIYELVEQCKTSSYTQQPFYPNFQESSCVNDGKQSEWMAGNYLEENKWLCCHNFFSQDDQLLNGCLGDLDCANC